MFSRSMLAAGLAVMTSLATASPVQGSTLSQRQAIHTDHDTPAYCQVTSNIRADLPYQYLDLSQDCEDAGLGNKCCVSAFGEGPGHILSDREMNDLKQALAAQSKKTSKTATTKQGVWTASFGDIVFDHNDLIDSQLLQVWFRAIDDGINQDHSEDLGALVFQIIQGTDDISNFIRLDRGTY